MRAGIPVPGRTLPEAVSQLTHRVFGPLRRDRTIAVLDFHGLAGHPATTLADTAARHGIVAATLRNWVRRVADAGTDLPLPPALVTAAMRPSRPGEDHLARTRIAHTLGLPEPAEPKPPTPQGVPRPPRSPDRISPSAWAGVRLLATLGPLDLDTVVTAVNRQRSIHRCDPLSGSVMAESLHRVGATVDEHGRWHPPSGRSAPPRYRKVADAAAGRVLSRGDLIAVLIAAGHTAPAAEALSIRHPLFVRVAPNRYRLVGDPVPHAGRPTTRVGA